MTETPERPDKRPESPTTARPLEFDDDQQETGIIQADGSSTTNTGALGKSSPAQGSDHHNTEASAAAAATTLDEEGPPKPPRPQSPQAQAENTLIEAFPSIDAKVVKAVLVASGGQVEPAFNALLSMSDPNFVAEAPPAKPPRPTAQQRQLEQDEMYARQLADHYGSSSRAYAPTSRQPDNPHMHGQPRGRGPPVGGEEKEYSFIDDELPQIRENLRQGFLQTQTKFNKWITDFSKRIDGDDSDEYAPVAGQGTSGQRQNFGPSQSEQLYGIQRNAEMNRARRSTDRERYDADPKVLSDNFTELELRDEEDTPPPKPTRPSTNPNLFKPTPQPPQTGPVDEVDALYGMPHGTPSHHRQPSPASAGKSKKWQPLTSVAPNPDADENDPFALGDSDDERKTTDIRAEDTKRLKREASAKDDGDKPKVLQETERSGSMGTRNKEVEEILEGAKKSS